MFTLLFGGSRRVRVMGFAVSLVLSACGGGGAGGGGGDLTLDFMFSNFSQPLFTPANASAYIGGLGDRTPHCSISSGSLPPGLSMPGGGCTVTGIPTVAGIYSSTISLTVDGYNGSLTSPLTIGVVAPTLEVVNATIAGESPPIGVGIALDHLPVVRIGTTDTAGHPAYAPQPGDSLLFQVVSGSPPAGVSLDPATGTLVGTPTALGLSTMGVALTITHQTSSFTTSPATIKISAVEAPWTVNYPSCCNAIEGDDISLTPVSTFHPVPGAVSTFTWYGTTPDGLTLDPATGVIGGWVGSRGDLFSSVTQTVTFPDGSTMSATAPGIAWHVFGPVFDYVQSPLRVSPGQPFSFLPSSSNGGFSGDSHTFSLAEGPGGPPPSWLNVDPDTGRLFGVAPDIPGWRGAFPTVVLTTVRNGHAFSTSVNVDIE